MRLQGAPDNALQGRHVLTSRFVPAALGAVLGLMGSAGFAAGPSTVEITMRDPSSGAGIAGMQMQAEPAQVPAGPVTFHATNDSKTLVHEMLVVRVPSFDTTLPYNQKTSEVLERRVRKLGEIPDLRPGASGTLTLTLAPGDYLLLCNQPGHYKGGMVTRFTVSR